MEVTVSIPEYYWKDEQGAWHIDADMAYPALLAELKASAERSDVNDTAPDYVRELRNLDPDNPDDYWAEVVYQCAKLEVRRYCLIMGESPWPHDIKTHGDKSKWALKNLPPGRRLTGADGRPFNPATESQVVDGARLGREAREHYKRLRKISQVPG